mmetsp:Transcript_2523/g.7011  ORF Transcript_2523/g.7011 Transcript_2523/m.7011 type:complete len:95 (+) Transcript_2523:620-904(+)
MPPDDRFLSVIGKGPRKARARTQTPLHGRYKKLPSALIAIKSLQSRRIESWQRLDTLPEQLAALQKFVQAALQIKRAVVATSPSKEVAVVTSTN